MAWGFCHRSAGLPREGCIRFPRHFPIGHVTFAIDGRFESQDHRRAYARMYTTHSSKTAADFLHRLYLLLDGKIVHVQTDNGSEFHLLFEKAMEELKLQHWWSRVRQPKDNAILERFNRTIQEEFIAQGNAYADPVEFNRRLTEWLIEYDFNRPHAALGYRRSIEIACQDEKALPMYSSRTFDCRAAFTLAVSISFLPRRREQGQPVPCHCR